MALVIRAADFAARKHMHQRRKGADGRPYINHPIAVAQLLAETGGVNDSGILAAALLHDTLEDTETQADELVREFGVEVAGLVAELTDDKSVESATRKERQVAEALRLSPSARLIRIADKISNLQDIAHNPPSGWSLDRRREYYAWASRVVDRLRGTNAALEERYEIEHRTAMQDFANAKPLDPTTPLGDAILAGMRLRRSAS